MGERFLQVKKLTNLYLTCVRLVRVVARDSFMRKAKESLSDLCEVSPGGGERFL
jgi:hypothetical protein